MEFSGVRRGQTDLIQHLLRRGLRLENASSLKEIAAEVGIPYPTLTALMRKLTAAGTGARPVVYNVHVVDPFKTEFCHDFRIELAVSGQMIASTDPDRARRLAASPATPIALRERGPVERFIEDKIQELARDPSLSRHLILYEVLMLHGAADRDVDLHVLTNDGAYSVGKYVRDLLTRDPCVRSVSTVTIGWRCSFDGYSGYPLHVRTESEARGE